MRKLILLVAILITGCTKYPVVPMLDSTAKMNEKAETKVSFNCLNPKTGLADKLIVSPGKIYIGSQGMWFREMQSTTMDDGAPLIRYQADFVVWYAKPDPILTNMKDKNYRLACVKKNTG